MTYHSLVLQLTANGAADPAGEAVSLISFYCGHSREWCLLNRHTELPDILYSALNRRIAGEPLQYIIGEAWFYGNRFKVSPDCLIPQPDTEHAVALALKHLHDGNLVLDLCTGSGCIAISILKENTTLRAVAVDISEKALTIAISNAAQHNVTDRLDLMAMDVLIDPDVIDLISSANVIISNPPYINSDQITTLSKEVQHEPRIALDGGADGMDFYRRFICDYSKFLKPGAHMILEIGYDQAERIQNLCIDANLNCRLHKDFGGNYRVAVISRNDPRVFE